MSAKEVSVFVSDFFLLQKKEETKMLFSLLR